MNHVLPLAHAATAVPAGSDLQSAQTLARDAGKIYRDTAAEIAKVVVGAEHTTQQLLIAMIAGGHCLLEGVPGVAKTTLSKYFAKLLGCDFQRVQFTPDLLPSDVTGTSIFDRNKNDFVLRKGPIFCQILLADEINRAPAKTQSALLEAMQEYQVTVDGATIPLPRPFLVLATQNPVEQEGVYRLPEAQLDRFLLRIEMGYPGYDHEVNLLKLQAKPPVTLTSLFTPESILALQELLPTIYGRESLYHYIVQLAEATRKHPDVMLGASPRAALAILRCARARAALEGRHFFTHEDVQAICLGVLGHRLIMRPEAEIEGRTVADVVRDVLAKVKVLETE
ncbi:MAG TPA: MoxR family ATPase [Fimbriiglobus sp.]